MANLRGAPLRRLIVQSAMERVNLIELREKLAVKCLAILIGMSLLGQGDK
jgi:hypothetical protein